MVSSTALKERVSRNAGDSSEPQKVHGLLDAVGAGNHRCIGQDVVRSGGNTGLQTSHAKRGADHLALELIILNQIGVKSVGQLLQSSRSAMLKRRGRANIGEVMEVADGRNPLRGCMQKSDTPSSNAEHFRESRNRDGAVGDSRQRSRAYMALAVVHEVFVDF